MSSNRFQNTNAAIAETQVFDRVVEYFVDEIDNVVIDWKKGTLRGLSEEFKCALNKADLLDSEKKEEIFLTQAGRAFFVKLGVDDDEFSEGKILGNYKIIRKIGSGRESNVYLSEHCLIGRKVAVKVFYQRDAIDRYRNLFEVIDSSQIEPLDSIVIPIDVFTLKVKDYAENEVELESVVFPYRMGETLATFIENKQPLTPFLVREFITQVGGSLACLHKAKVSHGDLHINNIIVESSENSLMRFAVLDFSGATDLDLAKKLTKDWQGFREILAHILSRIPLQHMSLQRHLGAKTFSLVQAIYDGRVSDFEELDRSNRDKRYYNQYKNHRDEFIQNKFNASDVIALVRHEEITSPTLARRLFVPFEPFFKEFSEFGSSILHGHRGSGKSSYVAALAMLPSSSLEFVDSREKFGILFACRQGEFKQLRSVRAGNSKVSYASLKHLMIVKVIRRTLEILHESLTENALDLSADFDVKPIASFLSQVFPVGASATFESAAEERLESLYEATVRYELKFTDSVVENSSTLTTTEMLAERSLVEFLQAIRNSASVLSRSRFFLLFDDCGTPNMPEDLQRVLNELLRAANDIYCVKVTAERFSYLEEDSDRKVLEAPHDFTPFNLAESLILRGGQKIDRKQTRIYFEQLLKKRLEEYDSNSITDYLGKDFGTMAAFVRSIAKDPKAKGAYAGWNIIWQVADRTPRHLLELVSTIFSNAGIRPDKPHFIIPAALQDEAVRAYSEQKLRHIAYIPGKLDASGITISVGQHLSDITVAFGKFCRSNLTRGKMKNSSRERYYESLAIEIDRKKDISKQAEVVLKLLVRHAIFDDSILTSTRDGGLKQVIYVFNRIYAPAFGISVRRETHLRLWSDRFDRFLLQPDVKLLMGDKITEKEPDLFDDEEP